MVLVVAAKVQRKALLILVKSGGSVVMIVVLTKYLQRMWEALLTVCVVCIYLV